MRKFTFIVAITAILLTYSCCSSQAMSGIADADSIHIEYSGMLGKTRYVINHSDTLTRMDGIFWRDTNGIEYAKLSEPIKRITSSDVPIIKQLARRLFVERTIPDTLWTKPYAHGKTCWPILSVHVFKNGEETVYYYDTGEEKNGIVYSTSVQIKFSSAFLEFRHRLNKIFHNQD